MKQAIKQATSDFLTHKLSYKEVPPECNMPEETTEERFAKLMALQTFLNDELRHSVAEMVAESQALRARLA